MPSTIPSPGVLFVFVCIGGEKGIVWKEEGMEAVLSTLRAVWRTVEVGEDILPEEAPRGSRLSGRVPLRTGDEAQRAW